VFKVFFSGVNFFHLSTSEITTVGINAIDLSPDLLSILIYGKLLRGRGAAILSDLSV